jgi:putative DNA primase/helicase
MSRPQLVPDHLDAGPPPHDDHDFHEDAASSMSVTVESTNGVARRQYRLYSAAELDDLPPAEWIIEGTIPRNGLVGLIGAKGSMKTFTVLDLACRVAAGGEWHGRKVVPGHVVYIYAEGPFGARARVDAWCEYQRRTTRLPFNRRELGVWFLPARLPVNNPAAVAALLVEIGRLELKPVLVIVDTLNQNLDGDEDGKGMGGFVAGCSQLRDALAATVIAVHHTPLGAEDRGRGHSAFDGAIDTRLIVSRDAERVTLECTHQRNGPDGWTVEYEAFNIADSVVLKPGGPSSPALTGNRRTLLELGHRLGPATYSAWFDATGWQPSKKSSFKKTINWLVDNGYMRHVGKHYVLSTPGHIALGHSGTPEGHHA